MFIDVVNIFVKAGNGGNGAVSFHREKYIAAGGPDGGDGGKGGNIVFIPDSSITTLAKFRFKRKFVAENGQNGAKSNRTGKSGIDLRINVPNGTIVKNKETGEIIADVCGDKECIIAFGGNGGFGNSHFAGSTKQAPRFAKLGEEGEQFELKLELKLLADVGVIGYPNVGKSSLISVISNAKPNIANYHFTTITPVLGVVDMQNGKPPFVIADIPGLIEGAAGGVGLGHDFLRHIERCRLIVHMVDISGSEGRDPIEDFKTINKELLLFNEELANRKMIVVGNKCDLATDEQIETFGNYIRHQGYDFFPIMAAIRYDVDPLLDKICEELSNLAPIKVFDDNLPVADRIRRHKKTKFNIVKKDGIFVVEGNNLEHVFGCINFDDAESVQYFQKMLNNMGIIKMLYDAGIKEGDTVAICDMQFDFIE